MPVSHSRTSNLKIAEILEIFWPIWEPSRGATNKYSDAILPVRILRIPIYQPSKYEGMGTHSVGALVCQMWGKYRWIMEIAGQNVLFRMGSIKRLDLQTTNRYRAEPFWVYSYMRELHSSVVTTSVYMPVSHSRTSNLKIAEILEIFWPIWEPSRGATNKYSDAILPVRILRIPIYQPCKYEGMGTHSVGALVCQIWGKYWWIMEIAGQNALFC